MPDDFVPTEEWQSYPEGAVLPPGCETRIDFSEGGVTKVRLAPGRPPPQAQPPVAAPDFSAIPPAEGYDKVGEYMAEVQRLAALPEVEYDRQRKEEAKQLGVRASVLDKLVKQARPKDAAAEGQGHALELAEVEPWHEPVAGADLLEALVGHIGRFVIAPEPVLIAVALWIIHAHAFSAWWISPKLLLKSATKRSGKTLLCEMIERLTPRPLLVSSVTAASVYRVIEKARERPPTLVLDELDKATLQDEALRKLINASQRKSAARVLLSVPTSDGWESRAFATWAPLVLSGIGDQAGTVMDRSVVVTLLRKRGVQKVDRLRGDRDLGFGELARKCARWAADRLDALADADPPPPLGLHDRAKDNWSPLLAIADLAGGPWPERARTAASELYAAVDGLDTEELGVQLLADIREIFARQERDRIHTVGLVTALAAMPERPWKTYKGGTGLSDWHLASLLRDFDIRSRQLKFPEWQIVGGAKKGKSALINRHGFERKQFEEAWERYLAYPDPLEPTTPLPSRVSAAYSPQQPATQRPLIVTAVAGSERPKAAENLKGSGVASPGGCEDEKKGNPDFCPGCARAITRRQLRVIYKGLPYHRGCALKAFGSSNPSPGVT